MFFDRAGRAATSDTNAIHMATKMPGENMARADCVLNAVIIYVRELDVRLGLLKHN